jgi:DnaJ-class molecular chaperone
MTTQLTIDQQCFACGGSGRVPLWVDGANVGKDCVVCAGTGKISPEAIDITELIAKIDAIKAMLDSTVYGMQKTSSNLDDIMVKLDV